MRFAIGELDQRISLQSKTLTPDGAGGATQAWTEYAAVWARVRPLTALERAHAGRAEATGDYLVVIRRRTDVQPDHRIQWNGREMNIRAIKDRGPRSEYLAIEAELGAAA